MNSFFFLFWLALVPHLASDFNMDLEETEGSIPDTPEDAVRMIHEAVQSNNTRRLEEVLSDVATEGWTVHLDGESLFHGICIQGHAEMYEALRDKQMIPLDLRPQAWCFTTTPSTDLQKAILSHYRVALIDLFCEAVNIPAVQILHRHIPLSSDDYRCLRIAVDNGYVDLYTALRACADPESLFDAIELELANDAVRMNAPAVGIPLALKNGDQVKLSVYLRQDRILDFGSNLRQVLSDMYTDEELAGIIMEAIHDRRHIALERLLRNVDEPLLSYCLLQARRVELVVKLIIAISISNGIVLQTHYSFPALFIDTCADGNEAIFDNILSCFDVKDLAIESIRVTENQRILRTLLALNREVSVLFPEICKSCSSAKYTCLTSQLDKKPSLKFQAECMMVAARNMNTQLLFHLWRHLDWNHPASEEFWREAMAVYRPLVLAILEAPGQSDRKTEIRAKRLLYEIADDPSRRALYRLGKQIGKGSFGRVHRGQPTGVPSVKLAIKVQALETGDTEYADLVKELLIMAQVSHPNVVNMSDCFISLNTSRKLKLYIVSEYADAGDLLAFHQKIKSFPTHVLVSIIKQVLEGIRYLHSLGILHRDLKPANILLTQTGLVRLTDFGLSGVIADLQAGSRRSNVGTCCYRAPEMLLGNPYGPLVDIWSLGVIIIELVESKTPFSRDVAEKLRSEVAVAQAIINSTDLPISKPECWRNIPELQRFVRLCLTKVPENRPTAAELLKDPLMEDAAHEQYHLAQAIKESSTKRK